ncbi:hypothetical protein CL619_04965 [archaeon]|nr:hypothetical protein [archaeon]
MRVELAKKSSFIVLCLILLITLSTFTLAVNSEVDLVTVNNNIAPDEAAEFTLHITNNADLAQTFTIYSFSSSQGWNVDPNPLSDKVIEELEPGESYETTILAQPTEDLDAGIYYLNLEVDGDQEDTQDVSLKVYLGYSEEDTQYLPSISVQVEMDNEIDPREVQTVVLNLENGNSRNLSSLVLRVESELEEYTLDIPVGLEPLESKTQEFSVTLNPYTQAKDYSIFFVFDLDGETIKVVEEELTVPAVVSDFAWTLSEDKSFLKSSQTFLVSNDGNVENSQEFRYAIGTIESLFVASDAQILREDGQQYLIWNVQLEPGDSTELIAVYNYRIVFYLLIAFLLIVCFYLTVRLPITVRKKALTIVGSSDGLSEIKVLLEVRNKRKYPVRDVMITDFVPGIANVEKGIEIGTLHPHKVHTGSQGSRIEWQLSELDGLEQRIISYKIKAKLNILGPFRLPRSIVQFVDKRGKVQKAYSNMFRLDASIPPEK